MKTPHQLAEERLELSQQYSMYSGELAQLIKAEAEYYNANRANFKSDTAVKRAFEVTPEGVKITIVKLKLKAIQVQLSSLKSMLETLTNEAHGIY